MESETQIRLKNPLNVMMKYSRRPRDFRFIFLNTLEEFLKSFPTQLRKSAPGIQGISMRITVDFRSTQSKAARADLNWWLRRIMWHDASEAITWHSWKANILRREKLFAVKTNKFSFAEFGKLFIYFTFSFPFPCDFLQRYLLSFQFIKEFLDEIKSKCL